MKRTGLALVFLSLIPPLYLFWGYLPEHQISILFSQYAGIVSLIAMAWVQLMATRLRGMEAVFGPLDQIYVLHKWLAVAAILAAFLHDNIEPSIVSEGGSEEGSEGIAGTLGDIGYQGILVLGIASLVSFIPYHIWHWSHRLIGIFFALAAVHYLLIEKPFDVMDPIGLYVGVFCLIGVGSFLYLTVKGMMSRRKNYQISGVSYAGGVTSITLRPEAKSKAITHRAGQFAFLSFEQDGFAEAHPFTIASAPNADGSVRFCIASLGDYTSKIPQLKEGGKARISNGYGRFWKFASSKDQIWIAGGVGVTPFLAWLETVSGDERGHITFYYGVRSIDTSPFCRELIAHAQRLPNLTLRIFESDKGAYVSGDLLAKDHGQNLNELPIAFCGPAPMREGLKKSLARCGCPMKRFHYEEFQMRSGLGLRRLWAWITEATGLRRRLLNG